mmetsp:Transcript_25205/g.18995  ORF Transcript_25205/g.18995 Transcript_25205/m.18995 type:complete len:159 (+) Transcript_25205:65-541(+)
MTYKDRECYLGASEKLGYLDKGGKWRKQDWWHTKEDELADREARKKELEQIKKEEEALMRQKLGLDPYIETRVLLQQLREGDSGIIRNKLADFELKEITQKLADPNAPKVGFELADVDMRDEVDRVAGLGKEQRMIKVAGSHGKKEENLDRIHGEGED